MRFPRGRRARPRTSRVSTSAVKSSTSTAPCRRRSAENARSEPTTAPVCASAARAAACERPTFRQTTGFPASAQPSSADANSAGRRTVSRKSPIAPVPSSLAKRPRMSAASVTASPPDETTERKPTRGPIPRSASAIDPDCETTDTRPARKVSGTVPIQSETSSGAATPMQFGPSSRASSARARSAIRAATSGPAAPASFPRPGRKKARTPAASASRKASSTRSCPTRRAASSGCSGRSATLGKQRRPSTSSLVGCTPQAGIPDRTTSSTIRPCRGEAPTTATDRGKRRGRTRL